GRGEAGYTMSLGIVSIPWNINASLLSNDHDVILPQWWDGKQISYLPGSMEGRMSGEMVACGSTIVAESTLTRITFFASDRTEYTLIDTQKWGAPIRNLNSSYPSCGQSDASRGTKFVSTDGSGLTFISKDPISDSVDNTGSSRFLPTGDLYFPNGLRYEIMVGFVKSIRDRNGTL